MEQKSSTSQHFSSMHLNFDDVEFLAACGSQASGIQKSERQTGKNMTNYRKFYAPGVIGKV